MKQSTYKSQAKKRNMNNSAHFWNKKMESDNGFLSTSPIFLKKNSVVLKYLDNKRGNILDIGFGYGYIENEIISKKFPLNIYGIDISTVAVKKARQNFKGDYRVANILKIPDYKKIKFDYILALDVLEHIDKSKIYLALNNIQNVISKDGILIISIPINEPIKDMLANRHRRRYSLRNIATELDRCGFYIHRKKYLYAFKKYYLFKSLISSFLKIGRPNLLIILAKRK